MFSTKLRAGKAFAAEQKIWDFKEIVFKSKNIVKRTEKKSTPKILLIKLRII